MSGRSNEKWVTFQKFAKMSGVKRPTINYASTHGLAEAVKAIVSKGSREKKLINVGHELCVAYLQRQQNRQGAKEKYKHNGLIDTENYKKISDGNLKRRNEPNKIDTEKINSMTLGEILNYFGTLPEFRRFVEISKLMAETRIKEITYLEKRGALIDRKLVSNKIFGGLDSLNKRLLTESPKTIVSRLYNAFNSNEKIKTCEQMVEKILSQQLKHVNATAKSILYNKNTKQGYKKHNDK